MIKDEKFLEYIWQKWNNIGKNRTDIKVLTNKQEQNTNFQERPANDKTND